MKNNIKIRHSKPLVCLVLIWISTLNAFSQASFSETLQMDLVKAYNIDEDYGVKFESPTTSVEVRIYSQKRYEYANLPENASEKDQLLKDALIYGFIDDNGSGTLLSEGVEDLTDLGNTYSPLQSIEEGSYDLVHTRTKSTDFKNYLWKEAGFNEKFQNLKSLKGKYIEVHVEIIANGNSSDDGITEINLPGIGSVDSDYYLMVEINPGESDYKRYYFSGNDNDPTINAMLGDSIVFSMYSETSTEKSSPPVITGLPDVWFAPVFREVHYMCTKSILPGGYRPWVAFDAGYHVNGVRKYGDDFEQKYPAWNFDSESKDFVLSWTLNRTMDAEQVEEQETPPWWTATGKLRYETDHLFETDHLYVNSSGNNQRAGKLQGLGVLTLSALNGNMSEYYDGVPFDDTEYITFSDPDDIFYQEYPIAEQTGYRNKELNGAQTLWQQIPEEESGNSIIDLITWYTKEKHAADATAPTLASDYKYDGYEIWEGLSASDYDYTVDPWYSKGGSTKDPYNSPDNTYNYQTSQISKAPGEITVTLGSTSITCAINVESPVESEKFYNIRSDVNIIRGVDNTVQLYPLKEEADGEFKLVYNEWNGKGVKSTPSTPSIGNYEFTHVVTNKGGNAVTAFYRRNSNAKWVVMGGIDLASTNINLMRCNTYANENEKRGLAPREFPRLVRTDANGDLVDEANIEPHEYVQTGYQANEMHGTYNIKQDATIDFRVFDSSTYNFRSEEGGVNFYASNRLELKRMTEFDLASEDVKPNHLVTWTYTRIDPEDGSTISGPTSFASGLTAEFSSSTAGYYLIQATYGVTTVTSLVHVIPDSGDHNVATNGVMEVGKVLKRELTDKEAEWLGIDDIDKDEYFLFVLTDLLSDFTYNDMDFRSRYYSGNPVIDRFGPMNDYKDSYTHNLTEDEIANYYLENSNFSNVTSINGIDISYHMDPLDGLENTNAYSITNITSSYIESTFSRMSGTVVNGYSVLRFPWEISLPWFSESLYNGLILRNVGKPHMKTSEYKANALSGTYEITNTVSPNYFAKLDEPMEKLEYEFYLNLKYGRWVLAPNSTTSIEFYNYSDLTELSTLIASYPLVDNTNGRVAEDNLTIGESDEVNDNEWMVYPNPTSGNELNIIFNLKNESNVKVYIYDQTGRKMYQQEYQLSTGNQEIQLEGLHKLLTKGLYTLKVESSEFVEQEKFILE